MVKMMPHRPYLDRMVSVTDVAWFRAPDGTYVVTWKEDGQPNLATFTRERSAIRYANYLDTSGAQPTESEVREAERSLRELEMTSTTRVERKQMERERKMEGRESRAAYKSLRSLEPYVQRRGEVPVKRHPRRVR